jgi:hypothetical protein
MLNSSNGSKRPPVGKLWRLVQSLSVSELKMRISVHQIERTPLIELLGGLKRRPMHEVEVVLRCVPTSALRAACRPTFAPLVLATHPLHCCCSSPAAAPLLLAVRCSPRAACRHLCAACVPARCLRCLLLLTPSCLPLAAWQAAAIDLLAATACGCPPPAARRLLLPLLSCGLLACWLLLAARRRLACGWQKSSVCTSRHCCF